MQPSAYPIELARLDAIWAEFMSTGELSGDLIAFMDPAVLQSWWRCLPRLGPFSEPRLTLAKGQTLTSLLRAQADLTTVGMPFIEDIHQYTEGSDSAIFLSDGSGCVLAVGGDPHRVQEAAQRGLAQGVYWSEGQMGTNAIGLVLINALPTQIVGPEHFLHKLHDCVVSAAPIHDVGGRIIGAIGIFAPVASANSHTLGLVMAAGLAIGNQLQANWSLQEAIHRLSEVNTIMSAVSEGVFAWSATEKIIHVNEQAAEMLDVNPTSILGRSLREVLTLPPIILDSLEGGRQLDNVETTIRSSTQELQCLASLREITGRAGGEAFGYVVLLRPIEEVRQLVQQQSGTLATLTIEDVYGQSEEMRRVLRISRIAARGTAPVLLRGEGGVGKNHLAQAIHNESDRAGGSFISINCRAIPHELMPVEFLGQSENVTGQVRPSKFELADCGTLLLDQIEWLSLEMQAALLQLIETGHVLRLGGTRPIAVDIRIIAAATSDLEHLVAEGRFLAHLYYRFGVFNIKIPPLRRRGEDLPLLAERFLARITSRDNQAFFIDDQAMEVLRRYPWPGNVRELESVLEQAVHHCKGGMVHVVDLPQVVRTGRVMTSHTPLPQPVISVSEAEREAIIHAGQACRGHVSEMARQLEIGRTTLWRKMKRYGIRPEQFK